jgi:hypothetical protein
MSAFALVKRIVATAFVLVGGVAIVIWLWPEEIVDRQISRISVELILKAVGAVVAAFTSLAVVWSFWSDGAGR